MAYCLVIYVAFASLGEYHDDFRDGISARHLFIPLVSFDGFTIDFD